MDTVRAMLRESQTRHLLETYCGVGFFAIELADAVESFTGVEYRQTGDPGRAPERGGARADEW